MKKKTIDKKKNKKNVIAIIIIILFAIIVNYCIFLFRKIYANKICHARYADVTVTKIDKDWYCCAFENKDFNCLRVR